MLPGFTMKGSWKNEVGGWNSKDSRRRKQNRKHQLRDNGLYLRRHEDKSPQVREENDLEIVGKEVIKHGKTLQIYLIKIEKSWGSTSNRKAFTHNLNSYWGVKWYDVETRKEIATGFPIKIIKPLWTEYTHFDEPKVSVKGFWSSGWGMFTDKTFYYGKPIHDGEVNYPRGGKARKSAQKKVNSMDRARLRDWISKGNWETDVRQHSLSKSIAWEIW